MSLDIICLTLPILLFFNIKFTKRIKVYCFLFISNYLVYGVFKNADLQWNLLYQEEYKLHEYIKEKEDE